MGITARNPAGRKNIVITDIPDESIDCSVTAYSIEDALSKCETVKEIFVIGGGSIYRQFMPFADRLYITHVHKKAPADVYFPEIDLRKWKVIEKEEFISEDEKEDSLFIYNICEGGKNKEQHVISSDATIL